MLFLAPVVGQIPTAGFAGLLILIAIKMMDVKTYKAILLNHHWTDFAMLVATLLVTVFVSLAWGIACGLTVAVFAYLTRARETGSVGTETADEQPAGITDENTISVVSLDGPLFFHTARRVIEDAARHTPEKALVVCLSKTNVIDASGIEALKEVVRTHSERRSIYLSGVTMHRPLLENTGVLSLVGSERVFETRNDAIGAARDA